MVVVVVVVVVVAHHQVVVVVVVVVVVPQGLACHEGWPSANPRNEGACGSAAAQRVKQGAA